MHPVAKELQFGLVQSAGNMYVPVSARLRVLSSSSQSVRSSCALLEPPT